LHVGGASVVTFGLVLHVQVILQCSRNVWVATKIIVLNGSLNVIRSVNYPLPFSLRLVNGRTQILRRLVNRGRGATWVS
jgi:hypothetical protein